MDRLVNGIGAALMNRLILADSPLAGQRARIRPGPAPSAATPQSPRQQRQAAAFCSGNRRKQPTGT
jgi:hypothetical protein